MNIHECVAVMHCMYCGCIQNQRFTYALDLLHYALDLLRMQAYLVTLLTLRVAQLLMRGDDRDDWPVNNDCLNE